MAVMNDFHQACFYDFAKYVMHLQVVKQEPAPLPDVSSFRYTAPSDNPQDAAQGVPSRAGMASGGEHAPVHPAPRRGRPRRCAVLRAARSRRGRAPHSPAAVD